MRLLDITLKDLKQASRSLTIYFFTFGVPLLVTLLFFFIFGGIGGGDEGEFTLPRSAVVVANLDQGRMPQPLIERLAGFAGTSNAASMGDLLAGVLAGEMLADLMEVSPAADEASARAAVEAGEADVAVIIPAGFTTAMMEEGGRSEVILYQDPTLTIGPAIVEGIVRSVVDGFSAGSIGSGVATRGLLESGVDISPQMMQEILDRLTVGGTAGRNPSGLAMVQAPPGAEEPVDMITEMVSFILGGMMVFFAFYTAANAVETIILEEERGTLARLFTTPAGVNAILGGKVLSGVIMVSVQITVLMLFGRIVFGVQWGSFLPVLVAGLGIVIITGATGLFLVSLVTTTRQGGVIFGGVLTITGMMGMMPTFTSGIPNQPQAIKSAALFVPQGWAIRGLNAAMEGGAVGDVLPILGVLLLWSAVLAFAGQYRIRRRFA